MQTELYNGTLLTLTPALELDVIPVSMQSVRRWLTVAVNVTVGWHHFPPTAITFSAKQLHYHFVSIKLYYSIAQVCVWAIFPK